MGALLIGQILYYVYKLYIFLTDLQVVIHKLVAHPLEGLREIKIGKKRNLFEIPVKSHTHSGVIRTVRGE